MQLLTSLICDEEKFDVFQSVLIKIVSEGIMKRSTTGKQKWKRREEGCDGILILPPNETKKWSEA